MRRLATLLGTLAVAAPLSCYLAHERGRGRDFSSCAALGGVCEGSDLGCRRLGDRFVYAGGADCIERDEGYACCVSIDTWTLSPVGERCFADAMCASGACLAGGSDLVCSSGRECHVAAPSTCLEEEH